MKFKIDERFSIWCAIFIVVVTLAFSVSQGRRLKLQGWQLNEKMVKAALINGQLLERLDYFEVWKIRDKLSSQNANIFLSKWHDCAEHRGLTNKSSGSPRVYEVSEKGRILVNSIDSGLFQQLAVTRQKDPRSTMTDIIETLNLRKLHNRLYDYNKQHGTSIPMETLIGVLVTYLTPEMRCHDFSLLEEP